MISSRKESDFICFCTSCRHESYPWKWHQFRGPKHVSLFPNVQPLYWPLFIEWNIRRCLWWLTGFWHFSSAYQELSDLFMALCFLWKHENLFQQHRNMSSSAKTRGQLQIINNMAALSDWLQFHSPWRVWTLPLYQLCENDLHRVTIGDF